MTTTEPVILSEAKDLPPDGTEQLLAGKNIITIFSPAIRRREFAIRSPILWALLLGLLAGMICRRLPEGVNRFLIDDLASPIFSVVIGMMTGIMGPVIFVSMVLSIASLESINKLTDLGGKIIWRFFKITLLVIAVSIAVSLFFYHVFSTENVSFQTGSVISMILGVFPKNLFAPFLENNTPQLVVMGFAMGAALLMLGDRASLLHNNLSQVGDWLKNTSFLIYKLSPIIPFISTSSFLLVLIILTLELSFASPGISSGWVILFASLTLPPDYVGIFTVYKMLTTNYGSACSMLYSSLEQIEFSDMIGELDKTYYASDNNPHTAE